MATAAEAAAAVGRGSGLGGLGGKERDGGKRREGVCRQQYLDIQHVFMKSGTSRFLRGRQKERSSHSVEDVAFTFDIPQLGQWHSIGGLQWDNGGALRCLVHHHTW